MTLKMVLIKKPKILKKRKERTTCALKDTGKKKTNRLKVAMGPSRTILPPPRSALHRCDESKDSISEGSILSESRFPLRELYNENS